MNCILHSIIIKCNWLNISLDVVRASVYVCFLQINKNKEKIYEQLISLMAIFIAVAFVIFGGISSLTGLSDPLKQTIITGKNSILLYKSICIWFLGLFNILALFMKFVSNIIGKNIDDNNIYICTNILLVFILILLIIFFGVMYFISSRANVDDLKSIENKSDFVATENMPNYVKGAFISMEDERFYKHHGFDIKGTTRALFSTISDRDVQGGSTITQQVVKNYYYDNERSFTRKIKELF